MQQRARGQRGVCERWEGMRGARATRCALMGVLGEWWRGATRAHTTQDSLRLSMPSFTPSSLLTTAWKVMRGARTLPRRRQTRWLPSWGGSKRTGVKGHVTST